jgi:protein-tyrosine-phosphatase
MTSSGTIRVDFICVENAGRSQMAAAFAERERAERDLDDAVDISSAGTDPGDTVDDEVVDAMIDAGMDISDRDPTYVVLDDLKESHFLVTMGCSISEFNPAHYGVESRSWDLRDPHDADPETVREIRDEIEAHVEALFDEIEATANERAVQTSLTERVRTAVKDALSF